MSEQKSSAALYKVESKKDDTGAYAFHDDLALMANGLAKIDGVQEVGIKYIWDDYGQIIEYALLNVRTQGGQLPDFLEALETYNGQKHHDLKITKKTGSTSTEQEIAKAIEHAKRLDDYFEPGIRGEMTILLSASQLLAMQRPELENEWVKHADRLVEMAEGIYARYKAAKFEGRNHPLEINVMRDAAVQLSGLAREFANTRDKQYASRIKEIADILKQFGGKYRENLDKAKIEAMQWDTQLYFASDPWEHTRINTEMRARQATERNGAQQGK